MPTLTVNVGNASLNALRGPPKFACVITFGLPKAGTTTASREVVKSLTNDDLRWSFFSGGDHLKDASSSATGEKQTHWESSKSIFDALGQMLDERIEAQSGPEPIRGLVIDKHFRGVEDLYYMAGLLRSKGVALHGIVCLDFPDHNEDALIARLRDAGDLKSNAEVETFRERLRYRRVLLSSLKEIGKQLGIWHIVDANQSLEDVTQKLRGVVLGCSAKPPAKSEILTPQMYVSSGNSTFVDSVDVYHRVMSAMFNSVRTPYKKFPGTNPKPLSQTAINRGQINFKEDYFVRRKPDGSVKYILFYENAASTIGGPGVEGAGGLFLIPKHMRCVFQVPTGSWIGVPLKQIGKFVLEGELTRLTKDRNREKFLVHDVLCWCESENISNNLVQRLPWKDRHDHLLTRLCNESSAFYSRDNVIIVHQTSVPFTKVSTLFEPCDYPTEGVVFQIANHPSRADGVFMWRAPELVTIDFRLGRLIHGDATSTLASPAAGATNPLKNSSDSVTHMSRENSSAQLGGSSSAENGKADTSSALMSPENSIDPSALTPSHSQHHLHSLPTPSWYRPPKGTRIYVLEVFDQDKAKYVEYNNGNEIVLIKGGGAKTGIVPGAIITCLIDPTVLTDKRLLPGMTEEQAKAEQHHPANANQNVEIHQAPTTISQALAAAMQSPKHIQAMLQAQVRQKQKDEKILQEENGQEGTVAEQENNNNTDGNSTSTTKQTVAGLSLNPAALSSPPTGGAAGSNAAVVGGPWAHQRWTFLKVRNDVTVSSIKSQVDDILNDCLISREKLCEFLGVDARGNTVSNNNATGTSQDNNNNNNKTANNNGGNNNTHNNNNQRQQQQNHNHHSTNKNNNNSSSSSLPPPPPPVARRGQQQTYPQQQQQQNQNQNQQHNQQQQRNNNMNNNNSINHNNNRQQQQQPNMMNILPGAVNLINNNVAGMSSNNVASNAVMMNNNNTNNNNNHNMAAALRQQQQQGNNNNSQSRNNNVNNRTVKNNNTSNNQNTVEKNNAHKPVNEASTNNKQAVSNQNNSNNTTKKQQQNVNNQKQQQNQNQNQKTAVASSSNNNNNKPQQQQQQQKPAAKKSNNHNTNHASSDDSGDDSSSSDDDDENNKTGGSAGNNNATTKPKKTKIVIDENGQEVVVKKRTRRGTRKRGQGKKKKELQQQQQQDQQAQPQQATTEATASSS